VRSVTVQLLSRDMFENYDSSVVVPKFEGLRFENARRREERLQQQCRVVSLRDGKA